MNTYGKLLAFLLLASMRQIASSPALGQTQPVGLELPESVTSDGKRFFVSNLGGPKLNPGEKDGNGFISEVAADGKIIQVHFLPANGVLHSPTGMAVVGKVLYVADIDRIVGFDLASHQTVFELDLSSVAGFLNDLVEVDGTHLLVTETAKGKVFRIDLPNKRFDILAGDVAGANGLAYDAPKELVYVVSMGPNFDGTGRLYVKSLNDPNDAFHPVPNSPAGVFDGVSFLDDHRLVLSDWVDIQASAKGTLGKLYVYDLRTQQCEVFPLDSQSPADFLLDRKTQQLYIPRMLASQLWVTSLSKLKKRVQSAHK